MHIKVDARSLILGRGLDRFDLSIWLFKVVVGYLCGVWKQECWFFWDVVIEFQYKYIHLGTTHVHGHIWSQGRMWNGFTYMWYDNDDYIVILKHLWSWRDEQTSAIGEQQTWFSTNKWMELWIQRQAPCTMNRVNYWTFWDMMFDAGL